MLENCHDITVKNCYFHGCAGIVAINCTGNIVIENNTFNGINSGTSGPYAHSVQFDSCSGAGNKIINNVSTMPLGSSVMEDHINLFKSSGVNGDPILVDGNTIRGGGPSMSGSGIALGDQGGSYQKASNNLLIRSGQAGIAVVGGQHITVQANTVASDARAWSNVGIFASDYSNGQPVGDITFQGNTVAWRNAAGTNNPNYDAGNMGVIASFADNTWNADLATLLAL